MRYGLILTHNLSTLIVALFALIYVVFNFEKLKNKKILNQLLINSMFVILITSFYWIPLLETKFSADYQVYEQGMMSTSEQTASHGLGIKQLFVTLNDGSYVFELGPHILIMLALSIMAFRLLKPEFKQQYGLFLVCGLITLWMSTKYFPWKILPEELSVIQFPWRMLMMSAFFLSTVCSINMYAIIKKFSFKDVVVISSISIMYILAFYNILIFKTEEPVIDVGNYDLGKFSGREYEVVAGCGKGEYLPVNAYKNRFYIASREEVIYVLDGKAIIENEVKNQTKYTAEIRTGDAEITLFELPYIYYPGYEVRLDGMIVETYETENGFLGFVMGKEDEADLEVRYTGTKAMKISMFISVASVIGFIVYISKTKKEAADKTVKTDSFEKKESANKAEEKTKKRKNNKEKNNIEENKN